MQFGEFICCCDLRLLFFCLFINIPCGSFPSVCVSKAHTTLFYDHLSSEYDYDMLDDMWLHYLSAHCMRSHSWHSSGRWIFWKLWSDLWSRCWKSMYTVVDMRDPNGAECGIYGSWHFWHLNSELISNQRRRLSNIAMLMCMCVEESGYELDTNGCRASRHAQFIMTPECLPFIAPRAASIQIAFERSCRECHSGIYNAHAKGIWSK